jgi:hypothetical protein
MLDKHRTARGAGLDIFGAVAESLYRTDVPVGLSEAIGRIVIETYGIAADMAEERWDSGEMHDALAPFRRAEIETRLLSLRGLFPRTVAVESVLNRTRNAHHREVYSGRIAITQSKVESDKGPIRQADFRQTLAQRSQLSLGLLREEPIPAATDDLLWASFVHMPSDRVDVPAFVRVAFPLPDGSWDHSVSLFDLVPDLHGYAQSEELITLRRELRRRRTG